MKQPLLIFALALSVLFNVFMIAGYVKANRASEIESVEDNLVQQVAQTLHLDEQQRAVFADLHMIDQTNDETIDDQIALLREEMRSLLTSDAPDRDRLRAIADREAELRRERRMAQMRRFAEFVKQLTPEQRRMLAELVGRHMRPRHHARGHDRGGIIEIIEKFDADGDGKLNETESEAARKHMAERRRQHHELRMRFDADGDGELNIDEVRAFREAMGKQRGQDRPIGPPHDSRRRGPDRIRDRSDESP